MSASGVSIADVESCIRAGIDVEKLVVVDVSSGCGSKFEVYVSSPSFAGQKLLERHRRVNGVLTSAGLMARIHAVTIKAWTPEEFEKNSAQVPTQQA